MTPCNPFSKGWCDGLEHFLSLKGVMLNEEEMSAPRYGVSPKRNCPKFTAQDLLLLQDTVPCLPSDGSISILNSPEAKCYSIANDIVNRWIDKSREERSTVRPRAKNTVEELALKHMDIVSIMPARPKRDDSDLLDVVYRERKEEAIRTQTKPLETIQVRTINVMYAHSRLFFTIP